mgnify:CR=1 FL=1
MTSWLDSRTSAGRLIGRISWFDVMGFPPDPEGEGPIIISTHCTFLKQLQYPGTVLARHYVTRIGNSSPPLVVRDTVIVPPALEEGFVPSSMRNSPGYVMAFDAKTGQILAMVGGRSYNQSQLNRAVAARRQPGDGVAHRPRVAEDGGPTDIDGTLGHRPALRALALDTDQFPIPEAQQVFLF